MNNKTLQIATPTMGTLRAELSAWIQNQDHPHFFTIEIQPFSRAMNTIIDLFLTKSKADCLMVVDSDTVPPPHAVEHLMKQIEAGAGFATAITPIKRGNQVSWNVYKTHEDVEKVVHYDDKEPFDIVGCGSACFIVTRETLEKLDKPYFRHLEFNNGKICTGELYFCDNMHKHKTKMVCDPSVRADHFKTIGMSLGSE